MVIFGRASPDHVLGKIIAKSTEMKPIPVCRAQSTLYQKQTYIEVPEIRYVISHEEKTLQIDFDSDRLNLDKEASVLLKRRESYVPFSHRSVYYLCIGNELLRLDRVTA